MRQLYTLIRHELRLLLISPSTYLCGCTIFITYGLSLLVNIKRSDPASIARKPDAVLHQDLLDSGVFIVPLLTMRSIAGNDRLEHLIL